MSHICDCFAASYPSRTLLSLLETGWSWCESSLIQACTRVVWQRGEHRYCISGRRYFPQKSTNLTCSTRDVKYTPVSPWQPHRHRHHQLFNVSHLFHFQALHFNFITSTAATYVLRRRSEHPTGKDFALYQSPRILFWGMRPFLQ